ncbi:DUF4249 domain-containing protein [Spirosoma pollinicola]|uniref:DUF4249 domain-containing protein n=1 Tax=Spirosoma pollinicola TaxID=2057025 RepID=A0A2K8Z2R2_9BACT|nr:DUF4249 domain-containing protein [Spirosoma pollinicola]AUD04170.1 DUF4249 domain-containing protein [Spirosoma pollinicola]
MKATRKTTLYQGIALSFLLGLLSCVEEINLPIRQIEPRLVVEGLITTDPPPYAVKLTFTGQFSSLSQLPEGLTVNGAVVTVSDDQGRTVRLKPDPLTPAYYYLRDSTFRGQPGRSYILRVKLEDGRTFVSKPERIPDVPPIDRLDAAYQRAPAGPPSPDTYTVLLDTQDPPTPGNYYRWSAYAYVPCWAGGVPTTFAGVTLNTTFGAVYGPLTDVGSDALVNGNRISRRPVLTLPVYTLGRRYVEVQQYSLTQAAYQYWTLFEQQRTRTGSLFDPQPASIEGNVRLQSDTTKLALGYFGASAVSRRRLIIPSDTINYGRFIVRFGGLFANVCGDAPGVEPVNWLDGK